VGVCSPLQWRNRPRFSRGSLTFGSAPVALAERCVVFISRRGLLLTLDENRIPVCNYYCWGSGYACPAIGPAGTSYLADRSTFFSAFDSHLPLAHSSWPRFRGNPRNTGNIADSAH
jgi:hypothetical protein